MNENKLMELINNEINEINLIKEKKKLFNNNNNLKNIINFQFIPEIEENSINFKLSLIYSFKSSNFIINSNADKNSISIITEDSLFIFPIPVLYNPFFSKVEFNFEFDSFYLSKYFLLIKNFDGDLNKINISTPNNPLFDFDLNNLPLKCNHFVLNLDYLCILDYNYIYVMNISNDYKIIKIINEIKNIKKVEISQYHNFLLIYTDDKLYYRYNFLTEEKIKIEINQVLEPLNFCFSSNGYICISFNNFVEIYSDNLNFLIKLDLIISNIYSFHNYFVGKFDNFLIFFKEKVFFKINLNENFFKFKIINLDLKDKNNFKSAYFFYITQDLYTLKLFQLSLF